MQLDVWTLIAVIAACASIAAFVGCIVLLRRGANAELRGDLNELTGMVERLARNTRRESMRRVRAGEKLGADGPGEMSVPPGAEGIPLAEGSPASFSKHELRRRVLAGRIG